MAIDPAELFEEHKSKLETYYVVQAAQNVILSFLFQRYDIGTWRMLFDGVICATQDHAMDARGVIRRMGILRNDEYGTNIKRDDLGYLVCSCVFARGYQEQERAWSALLKFEFENDEVMRVMVAEFVSAIKRERGTR